MWHKQYPTAEGRRQSPIDIVPHEVSHDPSLDPIVLNYDQCTSINISNNGHSVAVEFEDCDDRSGERKNVLVLWSLQVWLVQFRYVAVFKNAKITKYGLHLDLHSPQRSHEGLDGVKRNKKQIGMIHSIRRDNWQPCSY